MDVEGSCLEAFDGLRRTFTENFADHGEVGARICLIRDGETVVDLWGGFADAERTRPWTPETLVCTMSVSKGVAAMAAHCLADRGELDYSAAVKEYWPEFGQNGKESITVEQLLSHRAALTFIDAAEPDDVLHWDRFIGKIEGMFAPLAFGGEFDGVRLFSPETLARATKQQWHYPDPIMGDEFRCSMGLLLNTPFSDFGREGNVGSAGAGGFTVFGDPENRLCFAYTPNRFTTGKGLGDESRRLVRALYDCL